jgi:hypothetical protein
MLIKIALNKNFLIKLRDMKFLINIFLFLLKILIFVFYNFILKYIKKISKKDDS